MISEADLDRRFTYHPPTGDKPQRFESIRGEAKAFCRLLIAACPQSRELSIALTKIEEAVFWANASIARPPDTYGPQILPTTPTIG